MASRHRSIPRVAFDGRTVTEVDGASRTGLDGGLTVTEKPGKSDTAAALELAVEPAAARDRAIRIALSEDDVAALVDALAGIRDGG